MNSDITKHQSVAIIGAGVGGLFLGAMLAKEGLKVTLVEKNATIGGGLQTFRRFGENFDTGMHIIGGMRPGGNIYRICRYLGIEANALIADADDNCSALLYFAEDKAFYKIASGREKFAENLAEYFPAEYENLKRYVDAIYRLSEEADLFYLRSSEDFFSSHSEEFTQSASSFIANYVSNPKLRSILAYMNPLYGGRGGETPAFVHALINVLYINGVSRFVDGSSHFAGLLASVITQAGGEIITADAVCAVNVENHQVTSIDTQKGRRITADCYVSDIHPCSLFPMLPSGALPKAYTNRLQNIPNSYSAFSVYAKMKPEAFPYLNYSEFYMTRYDDIWNFGCEDKSWPLGFLMMTPPANNQGEYAEKVLITAPMTFSKVEKWSDTLTGQRGKSYELWKKARLEELLAQVEEIHPGFVQKIEKVNTASPLTIRDFYNAKEGTMCGFSKNCNNLMLTQLPVVTKVRNLLLTGQNNNLHGFCGVPLTAINTAEAILGKNYIINKINGISD